MDDVKNRIQNLSFQIPEDVITEIYEQAWNEALAEARQLLKQKMLQSILDQALALTPEMPARISMPAQQPALPEVRPTLDNQQQPAEPAAQKTIDPPKPAQPEAKRPQVTVTTPEKSAADLEAEALKAEIEAIRQKLLQNNQTLQQIKTPPAAAKEPEISAPPEAAQKVLSPDDLGYYVYCVRAKTDVPGQLPTEGIDPAYPLYTVNTGDLQAVLSMVNMGEYCETALDKNLHEPAWLESRARRHQGLLEELSSAGIIVPLRFCTIYLHEDRIVEMLTQHQTLFMESLMHLQGRQEWGVKAYYDNEILARHIEATNPVILQLKANESAKSSGQAYFTRKKLAQTIQDEVEHASDACAQDSHNRLTASAASSALLSVQTREVSGREQEMVFSAAYLIEEQQLDQFRAELEKLGSEYGPSGFSYDFTGPWPPYNFVNVGETG